MGKYSHIGYEYGDLNIYKWKSSLTYHLKILGEQVLWLSQMYLILNYVSMLPIEIP